MRKIRIETRYNEHECEICGINVASGGKVYIDDEMIIDIEPVSHCFNEVHASEEELLMIALIKSGVDLKIDGCVPHIGNHDICMDLNKVYDEKFGDSHDE